VRNVLMQAHQGRYPASPPWDARDPQTVIRDRRRAAEVTGDQPWSMAGSEEAIGQIADQPLRAPSHLRPEGRIEKRHRE